MAHRYREKVDALYLGMRKVQLRDLFYYLDQVQQVTTLLFTGGGSKNSPEYFFKSYLKKKGLDFFLEKDALPRQHSFTFQQRRILTYSLTALSGAANRAVGAMDAYKAQKAVQPKLNTIDFRVQQYQKVFQPVI